MPVLIPLLAACGSPSHEDMVRQSSALSTAIRDYDTYATVTLPQQDTIPRDVARQIEPARAKFEAGIEAWLDATNDWDLGTEPTGGAPSLPALLRFNEALTRWRGLQEWFVDQVTGCAGQKSLHDCIGGDPDYSAWQQAFAAMGSAAEVLNADAATSDA